MITLYSTDCPRCRVLKKKMDTAGVKYEINSNVDEMLQKGMTSVPMLEVDNVLFDFKGAVDWINRQV